MPPDESLVSAETTIWLYVDPSAVQRLTPPTAHCSDSLETFKASAFDSFEMDFTDYPSQCVAPDLDRSPNNNIFPCPLVFNHASSANDSDTSFLNCSSYDEHPYSSIEVAEHDTFVTANAAIFNATLPISAVNSAPFYTAEHFLYGLSVDTVCHPFISNMAPASHTPSLCDDPASAIQTSNSPEPPPCSALKRESTDSDFEPTPKRPQRKRNLRKRPLVLPSPAPPQDYRSTRLPHNQVERKYREGLNSELERLRRTIPSLQPSKSGGMMGEAKPSKATVLASAIDYIRKIEKQRDRLREENERLKGHPDGAREWPRTGVEGIRF